MEQQPSIASIALNNLTPAKRGLVTLRSTDDVSNVSQINNAVSTLVSHQQPSKDIATEINRVAKKRKTDVTSTITIENQNEIRRPMTPTTTHASVVQKPIDIESISWTQSLNARPSIVPASSTVSASILPIKPVSAPAPVPARGVTRKQDRSLEAPSNSIITPVQTAVAVAPVLESSIAIHAHVPPQAATRQRASAHSHKSNPSNNSSSSALASMPSAPAKIFDFKKLMRKYAT